MRQPVFRAILLSVIAAATAGARPLRVDIDSRLELSGAVDYLSAPPSTSTPNPLAGSAYVRDLMGRLSAPAAAELRAPRPQWTGADRARIMLSLSPLPKLERLDAVESSNVERAGGAEALESWLAALREFARASDFSAAFNSSRYLLDPDAENLRKRLAAAAPLKAFEEYARVGTPGQTTLLISPFQSSAAPGYAKVLDDGSVALTMVVGLAVSTAAAPALDFWSDRLPAALWNELAQTQLDPLAVLYADRIAQSSGTVTRPGWSCTMDWRRCVEEQVARAVTLRLVARRTGVAAAKMQREGIDGGAQNPMLTALLASLESYEKLKTRGAGLADYYPKLLAALPLDDSNAKPAPPRLPPYSSLRSEDRRRLAAFLKSVALTTRDPRLKSLAAGVGAWARSPAAAPQESSAALPQVSTSSSAGEELRRQGIEKYGAGQNQAALDDFQASLTTAPLDAQTLASKAAILTALGRDDEALAAYASALETARADADSSSLLLAADVLSSRATILERRKDAAGAVADLEDALRTAPAEWPRRKDARRRLKALKLRVRRTP